MWVYDFSLVPEIQHHQQKEQKQKLNMALPHIAVLTICGTSFKTGFLLWVNWCTFCTSCAGIQMESATSLSGNKLVSETSSCQTQEETNGKRDLYCLVPEGMYHWLWLCPLMELSLKHLHSTMLFISLYISKRKVGLASVLCNQ